MLVQRLKVPPKNQYQNKKYVCGEEHGANPVPDIVGNNRQKVKQCPHGTVNSTEETTGGTVLQKSEEKCSELKQIQEDKKGLHKLKIIK